MEMEPINIARGAGARYLRYGMVWMIAAVFLAGCAEQQSGWEGPKALSTASVDNWQFHGHPGWKLGTPHYSIFTTIQDDEIRQMLPQLMEGAYQQYCQLVPGVSLSAKPMECYMFNGRPEFNEFTKESTGRDANVYLNIRRGGYAIGDRYVSYNLGVINTAAVASHEGWHQFAARNFKGRLPPFFEEGLSTTFEGVEFRDNLPRWNTSINPLRAQALRRTLEEKHMFPLDRLIRMHAGDVVGLTGQEIDAFYSQSWAFAKFMREAEGGKYAPALRQWLAETADGSVFDPTHSHNRAGMPWNPGGVRPMIEHYLNMPLPQVEFAYLTYVKKVVYEEYPKQWNMSNWN